MHPRRLSVLIPAFNEATTLPRVIERVRATGLVHEIIIVDDGSSDQTSHRMAEATFLSGTPIKPIRHDKNLGKGAALRTALTYVTGDLVLVQDADLEYDPADYPRLLAPFADPAVRVVYGSRNRQQNPQSCPEFYWGGRLLSWWTTLLYGQHITDEATGYKVVETGLLRALQLQTNGFDFCAELTGRLLRAGVRIHEVPISYRPRGWQDGKKITWKDGVVAAKLLFRLRFAKVPPVSVESGR